jgi:hypothetical protein
MSGSLDEPWTPTYVFELTDGSQFKTTLSAPLRQVDSTTALHNMAGLFGEAGEHIRLDLSAETFCILLPFLKSGVVPRRTKIADWIKFVNACDYLGASDFPELVTNDAEHVYRSALTYPALVDREVEKRIRELHAARADGCDDPPADMELYAKLNERRREPAVGTGLCSMIERVQIGQLVNELSPAFNVPFESRAFVEQYPYAIHHANGAEQIEYVETVGAIAAGINAALPDFPWRGRAQLILAGGAVLKHMARGASARKFYQSDYDLFLVSPDEEAARDAITRVAHWVAARSDNYYLIARTAHAITFLTNSLIIQVVLRLYGAGATPTTTTDEVKEEHMPGPAPASAAEQLLALASASAVATALDHTPEQIRCGIEQILCGFDIDPCAVAFDGERVWTIPRAERAIRSNVIMVDPERQSTTALKRYRKYCYGRGFLLALPGVPEKTYARLRVQQSRAVSSFISSDPSRSMVTRLISGGRVRQKDVDYAPGFEPLHLRATPWATPHQRFQHAVRDYANPFLYRTPEHMVVMSRRIEQVLDTPASGPIGALRALIAAADPDSVYTRPNAEPNSVQFLRRLGHGQLSGSFAPMSATSWFPDE